MRMPVAVVGQAVALPAGCAAAPAVSSPGRWGGRKAGYTARSSPSRAGGAAPGTAESIVDKRY